MPPTRSPQPQPPVTVLACKPCRSLKVRCVREPENSTPCKRCTRLDLDCVPQGATRRGRPSNPTKSMSLEPNPRQQTSEQPDATATVPQSSNSPSASRFQHADDVTMTSSGFLPEALLPIPSAPGPSTGGSDLQALNSPLDTAPANASNWYDRTQDARSSQSGPSYLVGPSPIDRPTPRDPSNIRMADHIDRSDQQIDVMDFSDGRLFPPIMAPVSVLHSGPQPKGSRAAPHEDPVNLGILSATEAKHLVQSFMRRLNPLIALLDPQLHTYEYLRETSTILFSALLAASSKFFKKDVHQELLNHSNTILSRAIWNGDECKALVQSLQILVYFKAPEDTSAWRKLGYAIRMAYQFYWYTPRKRPLPEDRQLALETLDSERTWILLYVFDRAYSRQFGLPYTIRPHEIGDVEGWALDHPQYHAETDLHLTCVIQLQRLRESWEFLMQQQSNTASSNHVMVADMESRSMLLLTKWFGPDPPKGFVPENELRPKWTLLELMLAIKRFGLSSSEDETRDLDQYLGIVNQITEIIERLTDKGSLHFYQDLSSVSASVMCLYLRKLFPIFTLGQQALCVSYFERLLRCHENVSADDPEAATAFVARFIRRILAALGQEFDMARHHSPIATGPFSGHHPPENAVIDTLAAQLGPFTNTAPSFDLGPTDEQYWAHLLAATALDTGGTQLTQGLMLDPRAYFTS